MENVGCVTISERCCSGPRSPRRMYEMRAMVILHEMAHMWFGDLVTMKWWDDLWLNESFAEFCGTQASAEATRFTDAWTTFCARPQGLGVHADQQPSTHPIAADVPTLTEALANFDGISYAKGASVLRQLLAYLGRDAFFDRHPGLPRRARLGQRDARRPAGALEPSSGSEPGRAGRRPGWRRPGRTPCGRSSRSAPTARSPSFAVLQEAPRGASRRCGRTTSRRAVLAGADGDGRPTVRRAGAGAAAGGRHRGRAHRGARSWPAAAAGPDPAQRRRPRLRASSASTRGRWPP